MYIILIEGNMAEQEGDIQAEAEVKKVEITDKASVEKKQKSKKRVDKEKRRKEPIEIEETVDNRNIGVCADLFGFIIKINRDGIEVDRNTGLDEAQATLSALSEGENILRNDLPDFITEKQGSLDRRKALIGAILGKLSITDFKERERVLEEIFQLEKIKPEEVIKNRKEDMEAIFEIAGIEDQLIEEKNWDTEKNGSLVELSWKAAKKLRENLKIEEADLTDNELIAWEILDETQKKMMVGYQELMNWYGIDIDSMFSSDGVLKNTDGSSLIKVAYELINLQERPTLEKIMKGEKAPNEKEMIERAGGLLEKQGDGWVINMGRLFTRLERKRVGEVVHAHLLTEMKGFLSKEGLGRNDFPVTYSLVEEDSYQGLIFPNWETSELTDEMRNGLVASGNFYLWESIAKFERIFSFIRASFDENKLDKDTWKELAKVSSPDVFIILLTQVKGFGEILMHPGLIGARHPITGRPCMPVINENGQSADEKGKPFFNLLEGKKGLPKALKPSSDLRESVRKFARETLEDVPEWVADLVYAWLWSTGEGIDIAQCLVKPRSAEDMIASFNGAHIEFFYDYDGDKLDELIDMDNNKGWGRDVAKQVLRSLTPAMVPFTTITADVWKLMSISPWAQEVLFSTFYGRMPMYEPENHLARERLKKVIEMMNFKGPYKDLWDESRGDLGERFKKDVLHREQKRWGINFSLILGSKLQSQGGADRGFMRAPFNFEDDSHIRVLARFLKEKKKNGGGNEKILDKFLKMGTTTKELSDIRNFTIDQWEGFIRQLNNDDVREEANEVHKKAFNYAAVRAVEVDALEDSKKKEISRSTSEVKLELILRDLGTWGLEVFTIDKEGREEIVKHLVEVGEKLDGSFSRGGYTWSYNYADYAGWMQIMIDFPERFDLPSPDSWDKLISFYQEYGKRTGKGLPHVQQMIRTLMLIRQVYADVAGMLQHQYPGMNPYEILLKPEVKEEIQRVLYEYHAFKNN